MVVLSAGAVSVRVRPDLTKFAAEVKTAIVATSREVVHLAADVDAGKLAASVKAAVTKAGAGGGVQVPVTADTSKPAAVMRSGTSGGGKTVVNVDTDTGTALAQVARLKSQLDGLSRRQIDRSTIGDAGAPTTWSTRFAPLPRRRKKSTSARSKTHPWAWTPKPAVTCINTGVLARLLRWSEAPSDARAKRVRG